MIVRPAIPADAAAAQAIYAPHVLHGEGTFEETPPSVEEMAGRMDAVLSRGLPWIVAEDGGQVTAYAYASPLNTRGAYRYTVETTVYVADDARRKGYGRAVTEAVIERCEGLGMRQMVAVVGSSQNAASIGLHAALGFRQVGMLYGVGFKFGRWLDVVHMQKALGGADARPSSPLSTRASRRLPGSRS